MSYDAVWPLITVMSQVRVLPGPPAPGFVCMFASLGRDGPLSIWEKRAEP